MVRPTHLLMLGLLCGLASASLWIWLRPPHLYSEDCINFARSLTRFDPVAGQPQFPGYPLFVLQSRLLAALTGSAENAFLAGVIIAGAIALAFTVLLGREIGGGWMSGIASAALLLANPAFLFAGLTSTIRLYLAAVCAGVGYFCWRMWKGDSRGLFPSSLALGIGSGYRPELIAFLFPLWAVSAWRATRDRKRFAIGLAFLTIITLAWITILIHALPEPAALPALLNRYLADQARTTSPVFGATLRGWLSMLARLLAWNGMAIAGWVAAAPFARGKPAEHAAGFLTLWVLPALIFHGVVHVGAPDHALATIPAFCVLGGRILSNLSQRSRIAAAAVLLSALTLNLKTFRRPISMRPNISTWGALGGVRYFREQFVEGLWAMSWPEFRRVAGQSESCLRNLEALLQPPHRAVMVWMDSPVIWQKISYYFPRQPIWIMDYSSGRPRSDLREDGVLIHTVGRDPRSDLGNADRIVWITSREGPIRQALGKGVECPDENICWANARAIENPGSVP